MVRGYHVHRRYSHSAIATAFYFLRIMVSCREASSNRKEDDNRFHCLELRSCLVLPCIGFMDPDRQLLEAITRIHELKGIVTDIHGLQGNRQNLLHSRPRLVCPIHRLYNLSILPNPISVPIISPPSA